MSNSNIKTPLFGALFENEKKKDGTKSPDFTGSLGEDKTTFISAWYDEKHEGLLLKISQKNSDGTYAERGTGTLNTNSEKKSENQPDVKGEVTLDEASFDIAGWNKLAKTSQKAYISLKVSEPMIKGKPGTASPVSEKGTPKKEDVAVSKNRYEANSGDKELDNIFDFSE